jgi:spore maturation protein CgeB
MPNNSSSDEPRMKTLVIGNFSSTYVQQNWGGPLSVRPEILVVDVIPLLSRCFEHGESAESYILSLLRQQHFDLFFFYSDGIQTLFTESLFNSVRELQIPIVTFHADDEPEKQFALNSQHDNRFDIIATCSARAHKRRSANSQVHSLYLPWGYNPKAFYPIDGQKKDYDLIFIGKHKVGGKNAPSDEDGQERQQTLVELKYFAEQQGIRFAVFGLDWDQHPILKEVDGGQLSHEEMLTIYARSKLVFNPGWSFDTGSHNYQIKLRHFEVAGCRACQITNHNPELAELFRPGEEILFYNDLESLKACILHYLTNDEVRESIAEAGYRRAVAEHSMTHRLDQLFAYCSRIYPQRSSPKRIGSIVVSIVIGNDSLDHKLVVNQLRVAQLDEIFSVEFAQQVPDQAYVHLIDSKLLAHIRRLSYMPILGLLDRCQVPVILCDAQLRLPPLGNNPVQVDRGNFNGMSLNQSQELGLPSAVSTLFEQIQIANVNHYLINMLFHSRLLRSDNLKALKHLNTQFIYQSHRTICEIDLSFSGLIFDSILSQRLTAAFCAIEQLRLRYIIWGAAGEMSTILPSWIERHPNGCLGYLDRALVGQSKHGLPVYSPDKLTELQPDLIFIAATISGPAIFKSLRNKFGRFLVLPLYDLQHGNWFCGFR